MITANLVLAWAWLIISIILFFCSFYDDNNEFKNGIKLSLWIIGSITNICSVVIYNSQFN